MNETQLPLPLKKNTPMMPAGTGLWIIIMIGIRPSVNGLVTIKKNTLTMPTGTLLCLLATP